MTRSMTGFASASGRHESWSWSAEIRSVNGRGFDIKLRMPDWIEGLEQAVRPMVQSRVSRGSVTFSLRVAQETGSDVASLNTAALDGAIDLVRRVGDAARAGGLTLAQPAVGDILGIRGVLESGTRQEDTGSLRDAILRAMPDLMSAFDQMRAAEGAQLARVLSDQIDTVEALVGEARALLPERAGRMASTLAETLSRVLENAAGADPDRVAQELALIAVKADVAEELDRLTAHVEAARGLLSETGPKGRKLDFLTQEFNREANTLCAKAQHSGLTRVGLDLKHVIDQMREQVQNVE